MVIVSKQGDKWIIVRAEQVPKTKPDTGTFQQAASPYRTHFKFWTGEKWATQNVFSKLFDTEEEARAYLEDNRELLEK